MDQGAKVNFKIASVIDQDTREIAVRNAWAVKDLAIPLKHSRFTREWDNGHPCVRYLSLKS